MFFLTPRVPEISVEELQTKHTAGDKFYFLDVRTLAEYQAGHLSFTDALILYNSLPEHLDRLPVDKQTPVFLFCRSGRRSAIATKYLRSVGYGQAYNVVGGIVAWADRGYEIVSG